MIRFLENRKCKTYNLAVDFESNKELDFVVNNFLSGDIERLDIARVAAEPGGLQKRIKVKTINFTEMLDDAQAPQFMEFLSLDTEGSEYDILNGLDHSKYRFGYISVEHNYKEPTRTKIKELLVSKGYTYKGPNKVDDDYIS